MLNPPTTSPLFAEFRISPEPYSLAFLVQCPTGRRHSSNVWPHIFPRRRLPCRGQIHHLSQCPCAKTFRNFVFFSKSSPATECSYQTLPGALSLRIENRVHKPYLPPKWKLSSALCKSELSISPSSPFLIGSRSQSQPFRFLGDTSIDDFGNTFASRTTFDSDHPWTPPCP